MQRRRYQADASLNGAVNISGVGFAVGSIQIDNQSGAWLLIDELERRIAPYTVGFSANFPVPSMSMNVRFVAAPVGGIPSVYSGGIVVNVFDQKMGDNPGIVYDLQTAVAVLIADPATGTKQDTAQTSLDALVTGQALQATSAKQDTQSTKLDSLITGQGLQATAAKQDAQSTKLDSLITGQGLQATAAAQATQSTKLDNLKTSVDAGNAAQATAVKQDAQSADLVILQNKVANVEGAVSTGNAAQATSAKQDAQSTKLDSLITGQAAQATASKQDTQSTKLDTIKTNLDTVIANTNPIQAAGTISIVTVLSASTTTLRTTTADESIILENPSTTVVVYYGFSTPLTAGSAGANISLNPGEKVTFDLKSGLTVYGRVSSGTQDIKVTHIP
jgi:hypothetical protein